MLRTVALFMGLAGLSAAVAFPLLSRSHQASSYSLNPYEFWRLPWFAGTSLQVSGNGYGEDTHVGINAHALDFGIKGVGIEGMGIVAAQEGRVGTTVSNNPQCGPQYGAGNYVEIEDDGGFVSRYDHLSAVGRNTGDYIEPGWIIGQAGHTGYTDSGDPLHPCEPLGAHLHFRITGCPGASDNCIPEPMSDQCGPWPSQGIGIYCDLQGDLNGDGYPEYAFSADPSSSDPSWKNNWHDSDNAGVGYYSNGVEDKDIEERYRFQGGGYGGYNVVGKPISFYGTSAYVFRRNLAGYGGAMQYLESPKEQFGISIIAHGDGVQPAPSDDQKSAAFWIYGDFWSAYVQNRQGTGTPWMDYIGYPTSSEADEQCGYYVGLYQQFQGGAIMTFCSGNGLGATPGVTYVYVAGEQKYMKAASVPPAPPTPTRIPTRTRTPTPVRTATFIPVASATVGSGPTATTGPTPTATSTPRIIPVGGLAEAPEHMGGTHGGGPPAGEIAMLAGVALVVVTAGGWYAWGRLGRQRR